MDISSDFKLTATKDASRALMFDVIDGQFAYQDGMTGFDLLVLFSELCGLLKIISVFLGFNAAVLDSSAVADGIDTSATVGPFDPLKPVNGPNPMDSIDIPIDMGPSNPMTIDLSVPLEGVFLDSSSPDDPSLDGYLDSSSNSLDDSADFPDSPLVTTIATVVGADQTPEATPINTPVAITSEISSESADPVTPVPIGGASLNSFFLQFSRSSFYNYSSLHLNIN